MGRRGGGVLLYNISYQSKYTEYEVKKKVKVKVVFI